MFAMMLWSLGMSRNIDVWDYEDERSVEIVFCSKNLLDEWSVTRVRNGFSVVNCTASAGSR